MTSLERADLFFAVTTAVVVLLGALAVAILVRVYMIVSAVHKIASLLRKESEAFRDSVLESVLAAKSSGIVRYLAGLFFGKGGGPKRSSRKRK